MQSRYWFFMLLALWVSPRAFAQEVEAPAEAAPAAPPRAAAKPAEYEYIPILESVYSAGKVTDATRNIERIVKQIYQGDMPLVGNEASFDKYFTLYIFPRMAQLDDEGLARLPKDRRDFLHMHLRARKKPEVHDHLVQLTFNSMREIAGKNYHPAVRYNAMYIIGELNSKEAVLSGGATPPEPYADARELLLNVALDDRQIDAVRVPALLGILRHADLNAYRANDRQYPNTVRTKMVKDMLPLVLEKKVPANRSPEGHAWMRARAVETVAALGQPSFDQSVVTALTTIIGDANEPLSLRYAAANSLGRLNLSAGAQVAGDEIGRKLADLAIAGAREQLAELDAEIAAEKEKAKLAGGGGGIYPPGGVRGSGGGVLPPSGRGYGLGGDPYGNIQDPKALKLENRLSLQMRLLKDRMVKTKMGLSGSENTTGAISGAKPGKPKDYVTAVGDGVDALRKVGDLKPAEGKQLTVAELAKELRLKINDLEKIAKNVAAPAAPMPAAPMDPAEGPEGPEGPAAAAPVAAEAVAPKAGESPEGPEGP